MRFFNGLKRADAFINSKYQKILGSFFGKLAVKLISEIILAGLIALAVYCATTLYHNSLAVSEDNKKLERIYISVSDEYVNSLFGTPYISLAENDDLTNNFYMLNKAVLRTVSENNSVVAFFITSTDKNRKLPVDSYETEKRRIGKITYSDISFANPIANFNHTASGRYNFYSETQGTGRYGMFNYYLYGSTPYGFDDRSSNSLIGAKAFGESRQQEIEELRSKAKPNTFGVIADGYQDKISIIPIGEAWENVQYLLTKN